MLNDLFEFKKIKEGDVKAFERIFRHYFTPLYLFAFSLTGQKETSEEIVQDIFYIIWKDREKIQILQSVKSYLYKAVKNRSLQYFEHQHVEAVYQERLMQQTGSPAEATPDEMLTYKELEDVLKQTLNRLPERCRHIFYMHRMNGQKYKEIAATLSISVKTVEADMTKAYRMLRKEVDKYYTQ